MTTDLGTIYYYQRDHGRAETQVRAALAIDPQYADAFRYLAAIEEQRKNHAASISASAKLLELSGDPDIAAAVRQAFASSGYQATLQTWLERLVRKAERTYVSPLDIAELHARLGHREETFDWLRKTQEERSPGLIWAAVEPRWDPYRADARFQALLRTLNLK
jgi:tetratricopeptide (TPR) repeat protein